MNKTIGRVNASNLISLSLDDLVQIYNDVDGQSKLMKGSVLLEARSRPECNSDIKFGKFRSENFSDLSEKMAGMLMDLARFFTDDRPLGNIPISIAYEISAPKNKEHADAMYKAVNGEKITRKAYVERIECEIPFFKKKKQARISAENKIKADNEVKAKAKAERDAKSAEIMKKYKKAQEDRESEKPKPKQEYIPKDEDDTQSASDRLREAMLKIAKPNYSDEIIRIAECLKAGDDKLIKKVRSFIIQNTHPDKTKNDVYKESYLKLTEVK